MFDGTVPRVPERIGFERVTELLLTSLGPSLAGNAIDIQPRTRHVDRE